MSESSGEAPLPDLMAALMNNPIKKKLLLQLLVQEKDGFEAYKRQESKETTPLKNLKKPHCESPSSLQRRRALERKHQELTSEGSGSETSEVGAAPTGPKQPFDQLLKGVRAYVEVRRNNVDRSDGIKAVMKLMGATIKEKFTNDVTHVVFKDGCFTTFDKAKLMKIHLVSVLWLDAVRRNNARVPEKNYPAFGSKVCDADVSIMCSQLQKDFEEVLRDEKRRRMSSVPNESSSTMEEKSGRRTSVSPQISKRNSRVRVVTLNQEFSDEENDVESTGQPDSPSLTSDDSDCGIINGHITKRRKNTFDVIEASPLLPNDGGNTTKNNQNCSDLNSSDSPSLLTRATASSRKTVHLLSDMVLTPNIDLQDNRRMIVPSKANNVLQNSNQQSSTMSSLKISTDSDLTKSGLVNSSSNLTNSKQITRSIHEKENSRETTHTSMSSLRLSVSSAKDTLNTKAMSTSATDLVSTRSKSTSRTSLISSKIISRTNSSVNEVSASMEPLDDKGKAKNNTKTKVKPKDKNDKGRKNAEIHEIQNQSGVTYSLRKSRRTIHYAADSQLDSEESDGDVQTSRNSRSCNSDSTQSNLDAGVSTRSASKKTPKRAREFENDLNTHSDSTQIRSVNSAEIEAKRKSKSRKNSRSSSSIESPTKKTRIDRPPKVRKLYNPNEVTHLSPSEDDQEREEYQMQKKVKSPENPGNVFVNPNNVVLAPVPGKRTLRSTTDSEFSDDGLDEVLLQKVNEKKSKKNKRAKTPVRNKISRDSRADEQRELLELLNKSSQVRRSGRLSLSQSKPNYVYIPPSSDNGSISSLPITPIKRRSTLDFTFLSQTQKRRLKLDPKRSSSIVCSKLHRAEVSKFENIVKTLGRFFVENKVTERTTHLVAGECKRTINMLRAIARGCWILKHEWLLKSQEEGRWLDEEAYEMTEFSSAVQQCRLQREAFGSYFSMDIFKDCGRIYIARNTRPKPHELKELILLCKGKLSVSDRDADIVVGESSTKEGVRCVTEMWILDSIAANKLKSLKNYLIVSKTRRSPDF